MYSSFAASFAITVAAVFYSLYTRMLAIDGNHLDDITEWSPAREKWPGSVVPVALLGELPHWPTYQQHGPFLVFH